MIRLKVTTAEQMREFDRRAADEYCVPSIVLMENAGSSVFQEVVETLESVRGKRVAVVAGGGNNGGDGFVAARHLHDAGASVQVLLLADPQKVSGDARTNLDILTRSGIAIGVMPSLEDVREVLENCDLIIDAIFGTGLKGKVEGFAAEVIRLINSVPRPTLAVDIPSGLDANTGQVLGVCVQADITVTFALPKVGLVTYPGVKYVGRLVIADIGIPKKLLEEAQVELTEREYVVKYLPERPPDAHKGTFGTALVIGGSAGLTGAVAMAGEAALRAGAGLSIVAVPMGLQDIMSAKLTEVMTRSLPQTEKRSVSSEALEPALELAAKADAVVLGCGLGTEPETCTFVLEFVRSVEKPLVVDADGLNALSKDTSALQVRHVDTVITPHPGEMARLMGTSIEAVQSDRLGIAKEAAVRFRCVTVLKGARTVIARPDGIVFINPTGGSGLATGGTGDVLAGLIGGLLAQGVSAWNAAVCGTYIHGLAGDICEQEIGSPGMIAGDVCRAIPAAFKEVRCDARD